MKIEMENCSVNNYHPVSLIHMPLPSFKETHYCLCWVALVHILKNKKKTWELKDNLPRIIRKTFYIYEKIQNNCIYSWFFLKAKGTDTGTTAFKLGCLNDMYCKSFSTHFFQVGLKQGGREVFKDPHHQATGMALWQIVQ